MKSKVSSWKTKVIIVLLIFGPGIITTFAESDAGGLATYSVAASQFGYLMHLTFIPVTLVLFVTQTVGSRITIVTGKGLADLIRERMGIRIATLIFLTLFILNFAVILQNVSAIKAGLSLLNMSPLIYILIIVGILFLFITRNLYTKIERLLAFLAFISIVYLISAFFARANWFMHITSIVIPYQKISTNYLFTSVAVLGTSVTIWGLFFMNGYIKEIGLTETSLRFHQKEIIVGAILSSVVCFIIMKAVIATVWTNNISILLPADAALALEPFVGRYANYLFGAGLTTAGIVGVALIPLATAYAFSEFFGYAGSLDAKFSDSRLFYGLYLFQVVAASVIAFLPQVQLFKFTLYVNFINGIFLPVILYFLYRFGNDYRLMGAYTNSKKMNIILVGLGTIIVVSSIVGVLGKLF